MEQFFENSNYDYSNIEMYPRDSPPNPNSQPLTDGEEIFLGFPDSSSENSPSSSGGESDTDSPPSPPEDVPPNLDYAPRDSAQSEVISGVFDSLVRGKNLLVECPPGLERKMSILKGILNFWQWKKYDTPLLHANSQAYQNMFHNAPDPARIYVGTRNFIETENFVRQMKDELGTTQLLWNIKMSVLDERKNLCINENALETEDVNHACRKLVCQRNRNIPSTSKKARQEEERLCEYYKSTDEGALPFVHQCDILRQQQVHDIEDFKEHCHQTTRCPYYDGIHLAENADLVICPVKFLLSPFLRDEYSIKLENSIVLIDDGYDLENLCKKQATVDMTVDDINRASNIVRLINEDRQQGMQDEIGFTNLVNFLPAFSLWMANNNYNHPGRDDILEKLSELNIQEIDVRQVENAILAFVNDSALIIPDFDAIVIEKFRKFIIAMKFLHDNRDCFLVQLKTQNSQSDRDRLETVLKLTCADPSLLFNPIAEASNSIIVAANIIAPYNPWHSEFEGIFEQTIKIEYDRAERDRLYIAYTSKGVNGVKFELDFNSRDDPRVKNMTGLSLLKICETVPNGKICLFHSEDYLKKINQYWVSNTIEQTGMTIMDSIRAVTNVFSELEMRTEEDTRRLMNEYKEAARTEKGAVLLALTRGKLFKNWDLNYGTVHVRAIIHLSIPFGPWYTDDDILAKRKFLERKHNEDDCLQNKEWYHKEAFRLLNQSFCYAKTERKDWGGVIIVLDGRMRSERFEFEDELPRWCGNPVYHNEFSSLIQSVSNKLQEWNNEP